MFPTRYILPEQRLRSAKCARAGTFQVLLGVSRTPCLLGTNVGPREHMARIGVNYKSTRTRAVRPRIRSPGEAGKFRRSPATNKLHMANHRVQPHETARAGRADALPAGAAPQRQV
jgi:hypothetical protein